MSDPSDVAAVRPSRSSLFALRWRQLLWWTLALIWLIYGICVVWVSPKATAVAVIVGIAYAVWRYRRSAPPPGRSAERYVLLGLLIAIPAGLLASLATPVEY